MSLFDNNNIAPEAGLLKPGFADPVFDSQASFRSLLDAMSYPARIQTLDVAVDAPAPLQAATTLLALTLLDFDTPIWLDAAAASAGVPEFLKFHCGCPITALPAEAQFGIIADAAMMPGLDRFAMGEDKYPDRSATLIVQVPSLTEGPQTSWSGPGIAERATARIAGLPEDFWAQWALNGELYPLGIDLVFACGRDIVGLPRGVKVEG
jgi:alpha-D-ribose 1-methylphosphonate 5-triphosphate synthase subunit PhnH